MKENNVPALKRGLDLLEYIAQSGSIGFSQLEKEFGINSSSLNRLLKTLTEHGYLTKNQDGKYELGIKIFILSYNNSIWKPLLSNISEILHDISTIYKVTALLYIYLPMGTSVLDKVVYPDNVAMRNIGEVKKDYLLSPWGYLYLAHMDNEKQIEFINKIKKEKSGNNYLSDDMGASLINFAKENNYADDMALINSSVRRLAAPIYGKNNSLMAALAVGSFTDLLDEEKYKQVVEILKNKAIQLSNLIQGRKEP